MGSSSRERAGRRSPRWASRAFAVEALTDLVFIELPKVGRQVKAGESFCEVESVKAVSDVYAPVTGEVIAVNESLPDNLETLSSDPYGDGWIAKHQDHRRSRLEESDGLRGVSEAVCGRSALADNDE